MHIIFIGNFLKCKTNEFVKPCNQFVHCLIYDTDACMLKYVIKNR